MKFLLPLLLLVLPAAALDLVREGKPLATIVSAVPREVSEPAPAKSKAAPKRKPAPETDEAFAVRVLAEWVKKITDAELPVADKAPADAPTIYVGQAALAAGLKLDDITSPSHEGIRIVADGKRVLIAGQSEAATLKAVCRFLETLGCRYLMDGPLGEVFPRSATLSVGALNITEKPGLLWRNPKGPSWNARLWKAWNGAGGEPFGHAHSWGNYVSPSLFETHPEFFAMGADGQRKAGGWLCTSNPGLRAHFASNVVAAIERGTRNPSLSPTDGRGYCQCPACRAQDDPKAIEPSSGTPSVSNRYVDFFDNVARRVAQTHPEAVLSFYCYADYTQPPTVKRPLATNLCAMIAPIRYCRLHSIGHPGCTSREQQVTMTDGWASVAQRIGYYNYMYNLADGTLPMFKFSACQKEFPYLADKGLTYMTIEILSNWHIYGPQIYLSLRLAYDPHADPAAIMEDYWVKFYGPKAALPMKAYWMSLDLAQQRLTTHAGSFFGLAQVFTPVFLMESEALLAEAAAAAKGNAIYEQRVALHAEGLRSARAYRTMSDAMNRGDFATAQREYDATTARLKDFAEKGWANREYATAYLERFLSKTVRAGAAATAAPNRVLQVLPDKMRFTFDAEDTGNDRGFHRADFADAAWPLVATRDVTLDAQGHDQTTVMWYRTRFTVPPKHADLALFFGEVDGATEVYVNGKKVEVPAPVVTPKATKNVATAKASTAPTTPAPATPVAAATPPTKSSREGLGKSRAPFQVDVTAAVKPGENILALRVNHTKMTDLALGGILRPVVLIEMLR
ncbi:MAG: DUF4838 domain-containing protein [Verrucomicrobia bacterium]|nr:DUF4838 domain-containing protein [Verrucomicrobiota bacterium]NBU07708.1 DUF4838 domain-containing protein [Pseudomonadota bacterium]NDA65942.1 DUF4838 domain-containing protein [Verrucomicrobiota bacterium]NDB74174.1 DUF4838 domain-containing protein [Verrucomicrobiota bacterium]NDD37468.1 DUF4838 domain-containing protein [Verrucomicrobiota bacterium]